MVSNTWAYAAEYSQPKLQACTKKPKMNVQEEYRTWMSQEKHLQCCTPHFIPPRFVPFESVKNLILTLRLTCIILLFEEFACENDWKPPFIWRIGIWKWVRAKTKKRKKNEERESSKKWRQIRTIYIRKRINYYKIFQPFTRCDYDSQPSKVRF